MMNVSKTKIDSIPTVKIFFDSFIPMIYTIFSTITDKASVRSDAAAELDRLTRAQKKGGGTPGGSNANSIDDNRNNSSEC